MNPIFVRFLLLFACLSACAWSGLPYQLFGDVRSTSGAKLSGVQITLADSGAATQTGVYGTWALFPSSSAKLSSSSNIASSSVSSSSTFIWIPVLSSAGNLSVSSTQETSSSSEQYASSAAGSWDVANHAPRIVSGQSVLFESHSGSLRFQLSASTPIHLDAFDLLGRRTILFAGVAPEGAFVLPVFECANLRNSSGLVVLRLQLGSSQVSYRVAHRGAQVISVQQTVTHETLLSGKAQTSQSMALLAVSAQNPVDVVKYRFDGYVDFDLSLSSYTQGDVGIVFLAPIPGSSSSAVIASSASTLAGTLVLSPNDSVITTVKITSDSIHYCARSKFENYAIDSLVHNQASVQASNLIFDYEYSNPSGWWNCTDRALTGGDTFLWKGHTVDPAITVTLTPTFALEDVITWGLYVNDADWPVKKPVPQGAHVAFCPMAREGRFLTSMTPATVQKLPTQESVCAVFLAKQDTDLTVTLGAGDSVNVVLHFDPFLKFYGLEAVSTGYYDIAQRSGTIDGDYAMRVPKGFFFNFQFHPLPGYVLDLKQNTPCTPNYTSSLYSFPATYDCVFSATSDVSYTFTAALFTNLQIVNFPTSNGGGFLCDSTACPASLLVPENVGVKLTLAPSAGFAVESVHPSAAWAAIRSGVRYYPNSAQTITATFAPISLASDSIDLVYDPQLTFKTIGKATRVPRNIGELQLDQSNVHIVGYKLNDVQFVGSQYASNPVMHYYYGIIPATLDVPTRTDYQTLTLFTEQEERPIVVRHTKNWVSRGEYVSFDGGYQNSYYLGTPMMPHASYDLDISSTFFISNVRLGAMAFPEIYGSKTIPTFDRKTLGMASDQDTVELSYTLSLPDSIFVRKGNDPFYIIGEGIRNSNTDKYIRLWDGADYSVSYNTPNGYNAAGIDLGGQRLNLWTTFRINLQTWNLQNGDTIDAKIFGVSGPRYVRTTETNTAHIGYLTTSDGDSLNGKVHRVNSYGLYSVCINGIRTDQIASVLSDSVRMDFPNRCVTNLAAPTPKLNGTDTATLEFVTDVRSLDSMDLIVHSTVPVYHWPSLRQVNSGDRYREGDSRWYCVTSANSLLYTSWMMLSDNRYVSTKTVDSLACRNFVMEIHPWEAINPAPVHLYVLPAVNASNVLASSHVLHIASPVQGTYYLPTGGAALLDGTEFRGEILAGKVCLPANYTDALHYYTYVGLSATHWLTSTSLCADVSTSVASSDTATLKLWEHQREKIALWIDPQDLAKASISYAEPSGTQKSFSASGFYPDSLLSAVNGISYLTIRAKDGYQVESVLVGKESSVLDYYKTVKVTDASRTLGNRNADGKTLQVKIMAAVIPKPTPWKYVCNNCGYSIALWNNQYTYNTSGTMSDGVLNVMLAKLANSTGHNVIDYLDVGGLHLPVSQFSGPFFFKYPLIPTDYVLTNDTLVISPVVRSAQSYTFKLDASIASLVQSYYGVVGKDTFPEFTNMTVWEGDSFSVTVNPKLHATLEKVGMLNDTLQASPTFKLRYLHAPHNAGQHIVTITGTGASYQAVAISAQTNSDLMSVKFAQEWDTSATASWYRQRNAWMYIQPKQGITVDSVVMAGYAVSCRNTALVNGVLQVGFAKAQWDSVGFLPNASEVVRIVTHTTPSYPLYLTSGSIALSYSFDKCVTQYGWNADGSGTMPVFENRNVALCLPVTNVPLVEYTRLGDQRNNAPTAFSATQSGYEFTQVNIRKYLWNGVGFEVSVR